MLFVAKQLQGATSGSDHGPQKGFRYVDRPVLWSILRKFVCPAQFLGVLRALHDGAGARVFHSGGQS